MKEKLVLDPDRFFDPNPKVRKIARELYESVKNVPIVSPHGHVDPKLFAYPDISFGNPTELIIIPDHYLYRMLYSQGISLESLGIPTLDNKINIETDKNENSIIHKYNSTIKGELEDKNEIKERVEEDPKKIWQIFAENFYLFRGTPSSIWLNYEFSEVFGIKYKLTKETAMEIYDEINEKLKLPEFKPRNMFDKFKIEVLATTDEATSTLKYHRAIKSSNWNRRIIPTFRPDAVISIQSKNWRKNIEELSRISEIDIVDYRTFIKALKKRIEFFKSLGATSIDIAVLDPYTEELSEIAVDNIFASALKNTVNENDSKKFTAHILMEMAKISIEYSLVMQLHCGCYRNHNQEIYQKFGPDKGCDIPVRIEFTENLKALLNKYGNNPNFTIVVFTLDESTYSRELAPLAGHYPALKLGPPWWFHDSINGMIRFREQITETAGLYNTTGFVDDTRAFLSIPARHDLARRIDSNWLAGLVARHIIDITDAREMIKDCAYGLAKKTYKF